MKNYLKIIAFCLLTLLSECSNKQVTTARSFNLKSSDVFIVGNNYNTYVSVLKIYPCSQKYITNKNSHENLYICIEHITNDTLLVFEPCSDVPKYLYDKDYSDALRIVKPNIQTVYPTNVSLDLPPKFEMPKKFKFLFAHIGYVAE